MLNTVYNAKEEAYKEMQLAVQRGAMVLDDHEPFWWKRIKKELQMKNCSQCVLGQVFENELSNPDDSYDSGYYTGTEELSGHSMNVEGEDDLAQKWVEEHGFTVPCNYEGMYLYSWDVLYDLWMDEITERKAMY